MDKIKNILLTGATGFLGSHLLEGLLLNGYKPIVLIRKNSTIQRIEKFLDSCEIHKLNEDYSNLKELFLLHSIDAIIHTATDYGRDKKLYEVIESNVVFPLKLLEEGIQNKIKLFINTDSFFAKRKYQQNYLSNYTTSKRTLEDLLFTFKSNTKIVNLRLEHIFGENDNETKFVTSLFKQLVLNEKEIALTNGLQQRDLIYVVDVVSAYIQILKSYDNLLNYEEFEVGTGNAISIKQFVLTAKEQIGSNSLLNFGKLNQRPGDIKKSVADIKKLLKLGWKPKFTLNSAIDEIIKNELIKYKK